MSTAAVIGGDAEALAVAAELAAAFRKGAAERDAARRLPRAELDRLAASGLLAVTVPADYGGPDVRFGELAIQVRTAEALLSAAARSVDAARAGLTDDTAAEASVAVATAKVAAANAAVELGSALFEVSGTRSALDALGLHRHWRDARTHTLHDPERWKVQHIGRYVLNGTRPPRHGLLWTACCGRPAVNGLLRTAFCKRPSVNGLLQTTRRKS